jgi:hypothetical protein
MGMFDIGRSLPAIPPTHRQTTPLSRRYQREPRRERPPPRTRTPAPDNDPEDGLPHVDEYA